MPPRIRINVSPEAEAKLKAALLEVGQVGARALKSGLVSVLGDARKELKKVDRMLQDWSQGPGNRRRDDHEDDG